jgi:hypothetical protein
MLSLCRPLRCHLVPFLRRLPFATLKKMFGERLGIPYGSWCVMANSWRFNLTLVLAILPFTVTPASRAFADCAVSTLTVPASQWSEFIDGFDPRIVPDVNGTVLRSIRIYWIRFRTPIPRSRLGTMRSTTRLTTSFIPSKGGVSRGDPRQVVRTLRQLDEPIPL